jgi:hypothetical protein
MLDTAYLRVLATASAHKIRGGKFKGVAQRPRHNGKPHGAIAG